MKKGGEKVGAKERGGKKRRRKGAKGNDAVRGGVILMPREERV